MTDLVVLGATGSIGTQTLEVAKRLDCTVRAIAARSPSPALRALAAEWPDAVIVVAEPAAGSEDVLAGTGNELLVGPEAVVAVAGEGGAVVVNGIVGSAGLAASVAALDAGNRLALANKESLVAGGSVVTAARDSGGGELIPVDSEHSAIWQLLVGEDPATIRRIVLTASGGPFRGLTRDALTVVTPEEALEHPTWSMGRRITIDSATLMNKAFEVIEAHHLFGLDYSAIDVVVHPQSVVHSLVEFVDGAVTAELGVPDMRVPIQYAITYPERVSAPVEPLSLTGLDLTFEPPDVDTFPGLALGYEAGRAGGTAPAVLNAADEVAVAAFLDGRIGFLDIPAVVARTLEEVPHTVPGTVADVLAADAAARDTARNVVAAHPRMRR